MVIAYITGVYPYVKTSGCSADSIGSCHLAHILSSSLSGDYPDRVSRLLAGKAMRFIFLFSSSSASEIFQSLYHIPRQIRFELNHPVIIRMREFEPEGMQRLPAKNIH